MIRRPPRSTQSRSSAASDVYKRQVLEALIASGVVAVAVCGVFVTLLGSSIQITANREDDTSMHIAAEQIAQIQDYARTNFSNTFANYRSVGTTTVASN